MDTAKGCNFLLTNGGHMRDYWGVGKAARPMLPLIAIPTTAGTGSECQSAALIVDDESHQKMACLDPKAAAKVAILDPTLHQTTVVNASFSKTAGEWEKQDAQAEAERPVYRISSGYRALDYVFTLKNVKPAP